MGKPTLPPHIWEFGQIGCTTVYEESDQTDMYIRLNSVQEGYVQNSDKKTAETTI